MSAKSLDKNNDGQQSLACASECKRKQAKKGERNVVVNKTMVFP